LITPGAGYHLGMLALSDPSQRDEGRRTHSWHRIGDHRGQLCFGVG